jgi:hypothetical protein
MAAVPDTSKAVSGAFTPTAILLAVSGDTLTYTTNSGQELFLFNADASPIVVTLDGAGGTTVVVPKTGGTTLDVSAGYAITVAAGQFKAVRLDTIPAFLTGVVSIVAATGAQVSAAIMH